MSEWAAGPDVTKEKCESCGKTKAVAQSPIPGAKTRWTKRTARWCHPCFREHLSGKRVYEPPVAETPKPAAKAEPKAKPATKKAEPKKAGSAAE